jgi:hypothetical protein
MLIAEELRKLHDDGRVHGALSPMAVELSETGGALALAVLNDAYLAPEVIAGQVPDARSDIFAFGAIVFEMFTGRRAFEGAVREDAPSSGSPAVDRLTLPCMALAWASRISRMQKVILELKVLKVAARRAAAASAAKRMEERLAARLDVQERAVAEVQGAVGEAVAILRSHVAALREGPSNVEPGEAATAISDRVAGLEQALESMKRRAWEFEHSVAADLVDIEEGLRVQRATVEAVKAQTAQTDDVVERLVKALEALQRAVVDHDEPGDSATVVN